MAIAFEHETTDDLLVVTASGRDDDLGQVIDYGHAVVALARRSGAARVLCDERALEYGLGTLDLYDAAKAIAAEAPAVVHVAVVCRPEFLRRGQFWETVAVNRGLDVHVDTDLERAHAWLQRAAGGGDGT